MALKIEQVAGLKVPDSFIDVIVSAVANRGDSVGDVWTPPPNIVSTV